MSLIAVPLKKSKHTAHIEQVYGDQGVSPKIDKSGRSSEIYVTAETAQQTMADKTSDSGACFGIGNRTGVKVSAGNRKQITISHNTTCTSSDPICKLFTVLHVIFTTLRSICKI